MSAEEIKAKAAAAWQAMTDEEKQVVRFGMTPIDVVEQVKCDGITERGDLRAFVVALMRCADGDGGMFA